MAFWEIDLETRMGAQSAADQGGLACFVYAGLSFFGLVVSGVLFQLSRTDSMVLLGITIALILLAISAGFRLRDGFGAYIGISVAVLMVLNLLIQLVSMQIGLGLILNVLLLYYLVQGLRGAWALRKGRFDEDDFVAFE